jgi:hypothetical protein
MTRCHLGRALLVAATGALLTVDALPLHAYLKLGLDVDGQRLALTWAELPVRYSVSDVGAPSVSSAQFRDAIERAFATWKAVPGTNLDYQFGGFTSAIPGQDDERSTLGFQFRPDLDRVLASTSFLIDTSTGDLLESDIFFNSFFPWSVVPSGERGRFDVETIAVHEIGHFNGLGHSALGETEIVSAGRRVIASGAVMFPIAFGPGSTASRVLRADDIAGLLDLYPANRSDDEEGSISGRVTKNGRGVFGAHIVAFHLESGDLVAGFSLSSDGGFSIAALAPGPYVVRVEPLDDADIDSFFSTGQGVDLDFRPRFYPETVVVAKGADRGGIDVAVVAK